ncbi:MAG TPA: tripartite tricarboxylate transporter substrate binding protein [Burkholderiaceae bacterium]|nr:tripartite tricarboxylate transporter substrate binding protein [Burkholderiaceae bacterium]
MTPDLRRRIAAFVLALSAAAPLAVPSGASAQSADAWPSRPIRLVSPFPPGGTTDLLARVFAPPLSQALGQQVIVENRAGGSGSIGTGFVAKSPPDGYTFVVVFDTHAVNPSLIPNLPFDTRNDLAPVMLVATGAMVITGHSTAQPHRTFADVLAAAKANKGQPQYGTIGSGSLAHLAMTQMGVQAGFAGTHVPYKGGGPLAQDAYAGHVPIAIGSVALLSPHIRSGALIPLAVTTAARDPVLPNVPTVAESGVPGFEATAWWGVLAPARTPPEIVARMNAELAKLLRDPQIRERLSSQGMNIVASQPDAFAKFIDEQAAKWAKVVKDHGIRAGD